jgi:hypothetical protein
MAAGGDLLAADFFAAKIMRLARVSGGEIDPFSACGRAELKGLPHRIEARS